MLRTLLLIQLVPALLAGAAAFQPTTEYLAKVELLGKLTRFVEWPPQSAVRDSRKAFVLGIVGRSPFGDELDQYFLRQPIKGKPVQVRYCRVSADFEGCDLLFICASEKARLGSILAHTQQRPVLTVSDTAGFAKAGVMVGLLKEGEKLVFEVSLPAAKEGGIRFAPGFLQIARILAS
jgi:hypothetical protein